VHGGQAGLLIGPGVAGSKAVQVGRVDSAHFVGGGQVQCWKQGLSKVQVGVFQFAWKIKFHDGNALA